MNLVRLTVAVGVAFACGLVAASTVAAAEGWCSGSGDICTSGVQREQLLLAELSTFVPFATSVQACATPLSGESPTCGSAPLSDAGQGVYRARIALSGLAGGRYRVVFLADESQVGPGLTTAIRTSPPVLEVTLATGRQRVAFGGVVLTTRFGSALYQRAPAAIRPLGAYTSCRIVGPQSSMAVATWRFFGVVVRHANLNGASCDPTEQAVFSVALRRVGAVVRTDRGSFRVGGLLTRALQASAKVRRAPGGRLYRWPQQDPCTPGRLIDGASRLSVLTARDGRVLSAAARTGSREPECP